MLITLKSIEHKTSQAGKSYIKANLVDETQKEYTGVTIFDNFPSFSTLAGGSQVEGILKESLYNGKTSYTLSHTTVATKAPAWATKGPSGIVKAMEKKEASIEKFQTSKEESIKISSTMRDAVLLTVETMKNSNVPFLTQEDAQKKVLEWRSWLWKHWNDELDAPPF